jgi:hypothetical protein
LAVTLLAPRAAMASDGLLGAGCVQHSLSAVPIGHRTMMDTYIDNECGADGTFTISYQVKGPCPHSLTITQIIGPGAVDVVMFFRGPCAGHYVAKQHVMGDGHQLGQDSTEFDAPPG